MSVLPTPAHTAAPTAELDPQQRRSQFFLLREGRPRLWAVLFCMSLPLLWEGVPFAAVGLPRAGGFYVMTLLVLLGIGLFLLRMVGGQVRPGLFNALAVLMAVTFVATSIISGLLFFENPIGQWGPEAVYYAPCLLIFLMQALDIRVSEIAWGIALAATLAALLVVVDSVQHLPMMDSYLATSGFDFKARRIMLLKNEVGLTTVLAFAWMVTARSLRLFFVALVMFCLTFYDLITVIETRLVIGAAMLAMVAFLLTIPRNERKLVFMAIGIVLLVTVAPIVFQKYIAQLQGMNSLADDGSVQWRILTVDNYRKFFDQTSGLGFGIMSIKQYAGNILSYSIYDAPTLYGLQRNAWGFFLADTSFYGALFQFGYAGLILTVLMTGLTAFALVRYGLIRTLPYREPVAATGFFILFLLLSPWPSNVFTLPWSILGGNMMFSMAARSVWVRGRIAPVRRRLPAALRRGPIPGQPVAE